MRCDARQLSRCGWMLGAIALVLSVRSTSLSAAPDDGPAAAQGGRGPGLQALDVASLQLPIPPTAELDHVQAANFAKALGNDPERIFAFVRDHVAFEAYSGCLRGPRGTLLALAGNSVDRAALLAELLRTGGHQVRFARGTLSDDHARELLASMWSERAASPGGRAPRELRPAVRTAADKLSAAVQRNYALVRDQLQAAGVLTGGPTPEADPLPHVRDHVWVQISRDGKWIDLDPATAQAKSGETRAVVQGTLDAFPQEWFHRVTVRINVEEYPLLADDKGPVVPVVSEILRYDAASADLSGTLLVVSHQPENWKGPAASIDMALAAAIEDTGRLKPVVVSDGPPAAWRDGKPFRRSMPAATGLGGVGERLSGLGSRKPVGVATAEWLDVEVSAPDGTRTKVRRELFDVLGAARRRAGHAATQEEIRGLLDSPESVDLATSAYALFFSTGRIDPLHLPAGQAARALPPGETPSKPGTFMSVLRRLQVGLAASSDGILDRVGAKEGARVRFYPQAPRLQILDLQHRGEKVRLAFDLRLDEVRGVGQGAGTEPLVYRAHVLRGVVTSALEQAMTEHAVAGGEDAASSRSVVSTSEIFERARQEGIASRLWTRASDVPAGLLPADVHARLAADLDAGYLAVAPERTVKVGDAPRYGWWRIDRSTGRTSGMTDDGLHGAPSTEKTLVKSWVVIVQVQGTYYVEYVVAQVASSGLVTRVIHNVVRTDPEADWVDSVITLAQNVIRIDL